MLPRHWLMAVTTDTWEAEICRIVIKSQSRQKVCKDPAATKKLSYQLHGKHM
jgi:hypothetical protein